MAKIHELATVLADQIAAGEVVERPASVVKELVENAIDANSTQIDIYVKEAGIKEVTVIDNGEGIAAEDVPLAFFRHATSKIKDRQEARRYQVLLQWLMFAWRPHFRLKRRGHFIMCVVEKLPPISQQPCAKAQRSQ